MLKAQKSNELRDAYQQHFEALKNERISIRDCDPDPGDGMTIVTATCSSLANNRVPIVLEAIRHFGQGLAREQHVPINMVFAEWGSGLNEDDKRSINLAARAANIPVDFVKVSAAYGCAGHSFNEGLRAIAGYPGKLSRWVMKFDDDSIAPPEYTMRIAHAIRESGASLCGGWDVRTAASDDLSDPADIARLIAIEEKRTATIPDSNRYSDIWSTIVSDGKVDLAALYTSFSLGRSELDPICPNENGLVMSPRIVNRLTGSVGQLFVPQFPSGEGAGLFALLAATNTGTVVLDRKSYVLDRPAGGLEQEYTWGKGDADFAVTLNRTGLLKKGLNVARFNPERGLVEMLQIDSPVSGVIVYPEVLRSVYDLAQRNPQLVENDLSADQQIRVHRALRYIGELLALVEPDIKTAEAGRVFYTQPPLFSELQSGAIRSMLLHIAGSASVLEEHRERNFVVVRGSL